MKRRGVYAVLHVPTGQAYVGGSVDVVNRFTWHRCMLRKNEHPSPQFQKVWNRTREEHWIFVMLEFCRSRELRDREQARMDEWPGLLLNNRSVRGYQHSQDTKAKQRVSRAAYLETPGAREALSTRAKAQHVAGNFGRQCKPRGVYR